MSIITDSTSVNSFSGIMANSAPGSPDSTSNVDSREFAEALESALVSMGFPQDDVHVQVANGARAGGSGRQITITVGSVETAAASAATAAASGTPPAPVSPFAAAAPALRGLSADPAAIVEDSSTSALEYDPHRGPQITKDMWTEEMLTGDLSADLLKNMKDPSAFLTARLEAIQRPTDAKLMHLYDGSSSGVNASFLSTRAQAEAVRDRLLSLGIDVGEIEEVGAGGGPFAMDWGTEDRRMYAINGLNVGLIVEKYSRHTVERADQMILDQFSLA